MEKMIPTFAVDTPVLVKMFNVVGESELNKIRAKTLQQKGEYDSIKKLIEKLQNGEVNLVIPAEDMYNIFLKSKKIGKYNLVEFIGKYNFSMFDLEQDPVARSQYFNHIWDLAQDYMDGLNGQEIVKLSQETGKSQSEFYGTPFSIRKPKEQSVTVSRQATAVAQSVLLELPLISADVDFITPIGKMITKTINQRNLYSDITGISVDEALAIIDKCKKTGLVYPVVKDGYEISSTKDYVRKLKEKAIKLPPRKEVKDYYYEM